MQISYIKDIDMKGIIKAIKNDIYIHKREYGNSTIGFYTVAELFNGEFVDLTSIMEHYFGKPTVKKKVIRKLYSLKRGQIIDYCYDKELGLNIPISGTFSMK